MLALPLVLLNRGKVRLLRSDRRISVHLRLIKQEAELFAAVIVFALFTGRAITLFTCKSNLLCKDLHLLRQLFVGLQQALIFSSGDRYGVVIHSAFSLAFHYGNYITFPYI